MDISIFVEIKQFLIQIMHPEEIIRTGGLILILAIIFAETGLFFGFFLPGDSLLITTGLMTSMNIIDQPVLVVVILIMASAILGDYTGYWFGKKTGSKLYTRKDSLLFKQKHLEKAKSFFDQYGSLAIILGRFLPVVRTFAPIVAGMVHLNFRKFSFYNAFGAFIWSFSMVLTGYFFGILFPEAINHLELVILGIFILSSLPMFATYFIKKKSNKTRVVKLSTDQVTPLQSNNRMEVTI